MFFLKKGPPIILEVFVDHRAFIYLPHPRRRREKMLSKLLRRQASKEIKNLAPGRYHFNYVKVGPFRVETELKPIK